MRVLLPMIVAAGLSLPAAAQAADRSDDAASQGRLGREFVRQHCLACHSDTTREGDIRLDDLQGDMVHEGTRWAVVLQQVRDQTMPPPDAPQPTERDRLRFVEWGRGELARRRQSRPNLGNLVPHDLLFGTAPDPANTAAATAPRLWRLSPDAYLGWVEEVGRGKVEGLVQPFTAIPDRGIKDFAGLARVDEPTTEILLRNADTIVRRQMATQLVDGQRKPRHDTVREFMDILLGTSPPTRAQLEKAIRAQFRLAIARQPAEDEVDRLVELYERCATGGDQAGALRTMLTAVLLRSDALFRLEMGAASGQLTPREVAGAVSAALMNKRERRLLEAAERGELTTREEIAQHVRRILEDPQLPKPRLLGFFREYFEYHLATEVFKDPPPDLWHRPDQAVRDTDQLVLHVLAEDRDVFRQLLTTRLAFANVKTATNKQTRRPELQRSLVPNPHNERGKAPPETLYGLTEWTDQQPFEQPENTRLGILMQPSWLVAWSENFNNDIVRRGRFLRERLLGGTVPDLPIGVTAMIPDDKQHTLRERVGSATRATRCWRCHQQMDDLGLPFENFDHFGRLLSADTVLDPVATAQNVDAPGKPRGDVFRSVPLDTTGRISGTGDATLDGPVRDPRELVRRIADSDRCRQVWLRHVFRYYLGRNETLADATTLQEADRVYVASGGSYRALLVSLLTSDSFLLRSRLSHSDETAAP